MLYFITRRKTVTCKSVLLWNAKKVDANLAKIPAKNGKTIGEIMLLILGRFLRVKIVTYAGEKNGASQHGM